MTDAAREPPAGNPETPPPVPSGAAVNVQRAGSEHRVKAEVLGSVAGAYIVLRNRPGDHAGPDLRSLALRAGDTLIVRLLHEGTVFGFRIAISRVVHEPELLLFASYPSQVERVSVRKQPRLSCAGLPCRFRVGEWVAAAVVVDISAAGCGLESRTRTDAPLEGGGPAEIAFRTPDCADILSVTGRIRRIGQTGANTAVGIAFDEPQTALLEQLASYLAIAER